MIFKKYRFEVVIVLLVFLFCSCKRYNAVIHYTYNGITITRFDQDAASYFYYGSFSEGSDLPESYIEATYHGFDGSMSGYLVFQKDKSVILVSTTYFKQKGKSSGLFLKRYDNNPIYIKWINSIQHKYGNIVEIADVTKLEKQQNLKNNSKVKTLYK